MKRTYFILSLLVILIVCGCSKENNSKFLDPARKLSLQGTNIITKAVREIDTIDIIIRHCDNIRFRNKEGYITDSSFPFGNEYYEEMNSVRRDFGNRRFLWGGGYVISNYGK